MIPSKFGHVDLAVSDLERSIEFYGYAVFFYDPNGIKLEILHRPGREV